MSFGELKRVKAARVEKDCVWCRTKCEIGQPRVGYFGEFEREPQDWHMHPECYDAYEREDSGDRIIHNARHERGKTCDEACDRELQESGGAK